MNPLIIAAGIYLSARIISFIAGELTESELNKQKEIDNEIECIRSHYQETDLSSNDGDATCDSEGVLAKKREICDYLRAEAKAREDDYALLHEEIKESKRKVVSALRANDVVQTPLRKSSLELLLRQLSEAQEKCYSYRQYLNVYSDEVGRRSSDVEPAIFSMQLPSNYPYIGKVIWVSAEQLSERYITYEIPDHISVTVRVSDKDAYEITEESILPIMITDGRRKEFTASLEKGAFKAYELSNTHLGLSATVKEIQRQYVILTYQNQLELYLSRDNLIKPDRFPPVRSSLTVYPIKWEYNLEHFSYGNGKTGYPVTVSERKEDAGSSLSFKSFPICFSEEDFAGFMDYYEKNNLQDYDEEFLIGPVHSEDISLKKGSLLKLQFGDIPLFYIELDEYVDRTDILRYYFRFHSLCNAEEKTFSADDIFLPFDVSFSPYYAGTSVEMIQQYMEIDDIDDVAALIWDLFEEFRIQEQIRRDREGMGYFFKWENITNQLISVLEQGDSIQVDVKWIEADGRNSIFAEVLNPVELVNFIQRFAQKTDILIQREWQPEFFVKDDLENRYFTSVVDAGHRLRIVGKNVAAAFLDSTDYIELFASNRPYAEYQQKSALRQFRIGQVVNPSIQAACLNSSHIESNLVVNRKLAPFHNTSLMSNESQKKAVEQAFFEKNLYLIQGPPGTGKTTVIRELVEQVLEADEESRVLIVSQANVAVDNALKGLIQKYSDEIVRCGNGNKITEEFKNLRLQSRCQDYLDDLIQRKESFDSRFYEEWREIIFDNESYDYSPVLCELIIRNHRVIGATCVGLAKRNIGLERAEFDLVIIDEAGKALPAEMLIPLLRAKKAIIIGDQKQLPPVINPILYDQERIDLEERAISENDLFCHSFFERLYENAPNTCKCMLDTQYRMPSVIGDAISNLFYGGKLKNGAGTNKREPVLFKSNLTFINYDGNGSYREQNNSRKQITNTVEANDVVSLVTNLRQKDTSCTIAIITPYKGQKRAISNAFLDAGIHYQRDRIFIDTIDSFQGSEADVVVFCTTRAFHPTLFFRDAKRLNVAFSRVKRELILMGKLSYFYKFNREDSCLPALADYIKDNGEIVLASDCEMLKKSSHKKNSREMMLVMDEITLPSAFYIDEPKNSDVQEKIDEYCTYGDFLTPLPVKKTSSGYILNGRFEQFRAAIDLNLPECLCTLI